MTGSTMNWLESLAYATSSMDGMTAAHEPDVTASISVHRSERNFSFANPFWIRGMRAEDLGEAWPGFCQTLAEFGCMAAVSVDEMADLPTNAIPARLSIRSSGTSLNATEITTADAVVLSQQDVQSAKWARFAEVSPGDEGSKSRLFGFVRAIRIAAGGNTPVGLSLPVGATDSDVVEAAQAECDFLLLEENGSTITSRHGSVKSMAAETCLGVANVRRVLEANEWPLLPILLSAAVQRIGDVVKLLALGANLVSVDGLLREALPEDEEKEAKESAGRLSSLVAMPAEESSPASRMEPVKACLHDLTQALRAAMNLTGAKTLQEFNASKLVALDSQVAELTGVAIYGTHRR
ncbi:MAG: hypothetical protein AAGG44_01420 [Planctomycetota bacterium]